MLHTFFFIFSWMCDSSCTQRNKQNSETEFYVVWVNCFKKGKEKKNPAFAKQDRFQFSNSEYKPCWDMLFKICRSKMISVWLRCWKQWISFTDGGKNLKIINIQKSWRAEFSKLNHTRCALHTALRGRNCVRKHMTTGLQSIVLTQFLSQSLSCFVWFLQN